MSHAYLAPSSFDMAEKCPASVSRQHRVNMRKQLLLEAGIEMYGLQGDDKLRYQSYFVDPYKRSQDDGTGLHQVFEEAILGKYTEDQIIEAIMKNQLIDEGTRGELMIQQRMASIIKQKIKEATEADWFDVEHRIKIKGLPQFGTADWVSVVDRKLYIEDLKTGRNEVYAEESAQIRCYAVGVLDEIGWDSIDELELTIIGVKFPSSTIVITTEELLEFKRERMLSVFMQAYAINPKAVVGEQCLFCDAKINCPDWLEKYKRSTSGALKNGITELTTPEQVEMFSVFKQCDEAMKILKTELLAKCDSFNPPAGIKRVGGTKRSYWKDTEAVEKQLSKKVDVNKPKSLRPVSEVRKLCEQAGVDFDEESLVENKISGAYLKIAK